MLQVSIRDLLRVFGKIGLLSFGGPAAQIALMHRELVVQRQWINEQQFLGALSFCMMLPGPEAMQLATFSGWRLRGIIGGLIAGCLFILPGATVITVLGIIYNNFGSMPLVQSAFLGIKAAVVVIVVQALIKLAAKTLHCHFDYSLAAVAFLGIFLFATPFPFLIIGAGLAGLLFATTKEDSITSRGSTIIDETSFLKTMQTILIWGTIWTGPLLILWLSGHVFLTKVGLFFSKLALVTFGGAYAVLAYMTQTVVTEFDWLSTTQMIDALGLAETTPGPLILITQFVAMQAGFGLGNIGLAIAAGGVALWMTFIPCFLWVFAGAPYFSYLSQKPQLAAFLSGITAAIVGVIFNLSVWFALNIWFESVELRRAGVLQFLLPNWQSFAPESFLMTMIAAWALLRRGISIASTLGGMAILCCATNALIDKIT